MVARLALVLAERPNFEACGIAALSLQDSIGYRRRDRTTQLTQSLGEGPHAILHTRQHVITACGDKEETGWTDFRSKVLQFEPFSQCALFFCSWCQNHIWHFTELTSIPKAFSFRMCQGLPTHKLSRLPALKSALLAVGGSFRELKDSRVHVVLVRPPAVHRFTGHLLVPFPIGAGEGHRGFRLLRRKKHKGNSSENGKRTFCFLWVNSLQPQQSVSPDHIK